MTKRDIAFKILFAVELALIPMLFFVNIYFANWTVGIVLAIVAAVNITMDFLQEEFNYTHKIMELLLNGVLFIVVGVLFASVQHVVNLALTVVAVVLFVVNNLLSVALYKAYMPEFIEAVENCNYIFFLATLVALCFVWIYSILATIALITLCITTITTLSYKVYFVFKNGYVRELFNNIFRRKK